MTGVVKTEDISIQNNAAEVNQSPEEVEESLRLIEDLKFFLATAPANWQENQVIRRYYLSNDEGFVSCVFWNNLYYITGTDIVRCCAYRMQRFGREIVERKKFEEGIFSDLRNLKCGIDATLEKPKSDFLAFLYKNMCLKTQKKQKVFFWFSVPHDRLFADALERDLKRTTTGSQPTTRPISEPALSFKWESSSDVSLYDQITNHMDSQRSDSRPSTVGPTVQVSDTSASTLKSLDHYEDEPNETTESKVSFELPSTGESNYEPQQLVVPQSHPDSMAVPHVTNMGGEYDELDTDLKPSDILTSSHDDDDFPLDYFPVEIEYPQSSVDTSVHMPPSSAKFPNQMMFYEDMDGLMPNSKFPISAGVYEDPYFRDELAHSSTKYMIAPPISATRAQFMTNGEYYSISKDVKKNNMSSNKMQKDENKRNKSDSQSSKDEETPNVDEDDHDYTDEGGSQRQYYSQQQEDSMIGDGQPPPYGSRRMPLNESMVHPYTGMLLNPYMFYNMLSVDPNINIGANTMVDPFYGQSFNMDSMIHDMYPPQEIGIPTNYRNTPKSAYFNMRSPYGRNFPPPSAMNPYYTPYHRRQPSSGTRMYFNKANMLNKKSKSPPRKNHVSKPVHVLQKSGKVKPDSIPAETGNNLDIRDPPEGVGGDV